MKNISTELIALIIAETNYNDFYKHLKSYIEHEDVDAKGLSDFIFNFSKDNNLTDSDYYYDVLCELMSALNGRCSDENSLI